MSIWLVTRHFGTVEAVKVLLHNGLSRSCAAHRAEGASHCTIAPWAEEN